jgi:hypothetical protein
MMQRAPSTVEDEEEGGAEDTNLLTVESKPSPTPLLQPTSLLPSPAPAGVSNLQAVVYISFWIFCSSSLILFNKAILAKYNFPYPMFLTMWHMIFSTVFTQILANSTNMLSGVKRGIVTREVLVQKFLPIAVLFSTSLIFGNNTYLYLSVSFIQMLKAFTTVCVFIVSVMFGLEKGSKPEFLVLLVISLGVATTFAGELQFSMIGVVCQAIAIVAESTKLVLTSLTIKDLELDPLSTLFYLAPASGCFIFVAFMVFEAWTFPIERITNDPVFALLLVLNGLIAFALNLASVLLMGKTSALVLALSGIVKDIGLVGLSVVIFGSDVTSIQLVGFSISLMGLNLHREGKKNPSLLPGLWNMAGLNKLFGQAE